MKPAILLLLVSLLSTGALSQVEFELQPIDRVPVVGNEIGIFASPIKSDEDGNIFLWIFNRRPPGPGPIIRVAKDGKSLMFRPSESDSRAVGVIDFTPGPGGRVYMLAGGDDEKGTSAYWILDFGRDGLESRRVKLEASFQARRISVFPSGEFLISGKRPTASTDNGPSEPIVALFDYRGQYIRDLKLRGDVEPPKQTTPDGHPDEMASFDYEMSLEQSSGITAEDGYVYFYRNTPKGPIFAISPSGKVARRIELSPPPKTQLATVVLSKGQLVVEFFQYETRDTPGLIDVSKHIFHVIDVASGQVVGRYWHGNVALGAAFASYEPGSFFFIARNSKAKAEIVRAAPR